MRKNCFFVKYLLYLDWFILYFLNIENVFSFIGKFSLLKYESPLSFYLNWGNVDHCETWPKWNCYKNCWYNYWPMNYDWANVVNL